MLRQGGAIGAAWASAACLLVCVAAPGCGGSPEAEGADPETGGSTGASVEAVLAPDELGEVIRAALGAGLPEPLSSGAWLWAMAEAEDAELDPCFRVSAEGTDTSVSWQGECAHEDGDELSGTLLLTRRDETTAEGDRRLSLSYLASMDGVSDGLAWDVGGTGSATLTETPLGVSFTAEVGGTYDLGAAWASDGIDTSLSLSGTPTESAYRLTLTGGLTSPDQASLYLRDLAFAEDICPLAPVGVLSVRDPSSVWFDVVFGASCTGCGDVVWQDEIVGETCPGPALMAEAAALVALFTTELSG